MSKVRRRQVLVGAVALLALPLAKAQQTTKIHLIGYLNAGSAAVHEQRIARLRDGLRELGHVEGKDIAFVFRHADGELERLPGFVEELLRLKVEIILAGGFPAAQAAKAATSTVPIVMVGGDPVRTALVASFARPGGNVTGLSDATVNVSMKRVELLKEIVPRVARVAILWNSRNPTNSFSVKDTQEAGRTLGIEVLPVEVRASEDIERAFALMSKEHVGGLIVPGDASLVTERKRITEFAARNRLPAIYAVSSYVEANALIFYGANFPELYYRAASYLDKILKGAKPGDLPIQEPTRFELVVNLTTAKALGITIPQSILLRADRVIE